MLDNQKKRLSNRIKTCENEIKLAKWWVKAVDEDLRFWENELFAAKAELHKMQMELNPRCSSCGD